MSFHILSQVPHTPFSTTEKQNTKFIKITASISNILEWQALVSNTLMFLFFALRIFNLVEQRKHWYNLRRQTSATCTSFWFDSTQGHSWGLKKAETWREHGPPKQTKLPPPQKKLRRKTRPSKKEQGTAPRAPGSWRVRAFLDPKNGWRKKHEKYPQKPHTQKKRNKGESLKRKLAWKENWRSEKKQRTCGGRQKTKKAKAEKIQRPTLQKPKKMVGGTNF